MLAVLLISTQRVLKNFSGKFNFNKIYQQTCANFSEQLMNKTHFNSKIDFACYGPNAKLRSCFLFSNKVQKKGQSSRRGDQLCTRCFNTLRT